MPAWRERSLLAALPPPPQGAAAAALPGSKALALPPCECPNIERMPLSSMAPPITPAAEAAAVPRNELPPVATGAGPIGEASMGDTPIPGEPIGGAQKVGIND